jgi:hypothetical protein
VVDTLTPGQLEQRRRLRGRAALIGLVVVGGIGAIAGLVIGVIVHPATAVFAMAELGLPSAVVGAALGLLVGTAISLVRRSS